MRGWSIWTTAEKWRLGECLGASREQRGKTRMDATSEHGAAWGAKMRCSERDGTGGMSGKNEQAKRDAVAPRELSRVIASAITLMASAALLIWATLHNQL